MNTFNIILGIYCLLISVYQLSIYAKHKVEGTEEAVKWFLVLVFAPVPLYILTTVLEMI